MTERLEGATEMEEQQIRKEMKAELNLCTALQFQEDVAERLHVEFGLGGNGEWQERKERNAASLQFQIQPQPLFHKNFDLLARTLEDYLLQNTPYIY